MSRQHPTMLVTTSRANRIRNASRRGAGVVVFVAILFPAALFGMALTVDHGRILLASRQSSDIADSIVLAAASARTDNGDALDQGESVSRALATFNRAKTVGMLSPNVDAKLNPGDISFSSDGRTVTVTVRWEVSSLPLMKFFFPELRSIGGTSTRTARVCIAEFDARPCAYPV
jgi:Flp pilus assembly protein TadG